MHSSDHEQWYAALATGERDLPRGALDELERCSVCAAMVADLDAVRGDLERAAAEQREVLDEARAEVDAPGAAEAEQRLRAAIALGQRTRTRRIWPMVAAAAALICVAIGVSALLERTPSSAPGARGVLGETPFTGLAPRDVWPASTPLVWRYALPRDGWYVVRLREPERAKPFAESPRLEEPRWSPSDVERAPWPRELEWQVTAYDPSGKPLDSSSLISVSQR